MSVEIRALKKHYVDPEGLAVPVIDIPSFRLEDGEHLGLIGGSGTGKTTLLHLIAGILTPDSGNILFNLRPAKPPIAASPGAATLDYHSTEPADVVDITCLSEARRDVFRGQNIGYIFQTHHLLAGFTALENVLLGMSFTGRPPDRQWAIRLLNEVGLADRLHYRPAKLSVGQQQRVAVARALANRPKVVLADEPTGALDPKNAQSVLELIRKLVTEVGAALVLVSHDPTISSQLSRVVTLADLNRAATVQTTSH